MDCLFFAVVILCVHGGHRDGEGEMVPTLVDMVAKAAIRSGFDAATHLRKAQNTSHQASVPSSLAS